MKPLNLPPVQLKFNHDKTSFFDPIRKKYVVMLPEEWVRQHFVHYMVNFLGYPSSLIKVEFGIRYNKLPKRPDILSYDRKGNPLLLVECKSYDVKITKSVFQQVSVYNKTLQSPYVVVTNGLDHFCWHQKESGEIAFLESVPLFDDLMD